MEEQTLPILPRQVPLKVRVLIIKLGMVMTLFYLLATKIKVFVKAPSLLYWEIIHKAL